MMAQEFARLAGLSVSVVRYYARIGLLNPQRNPENGYRDFSQRDVGRVQFILKAKSLGFKISDIKAMMNQVQSGHSPCENARQTISIRLEENRQKIALLQAANTRMERAIESWCFLSDSSPGGDDFCALIEHTGALRESLTCMLDTGCKLSPKHTQSNI